MSRNSMPTVHDQRNGLFFPGVMSNDAVSRCPGVHQVSTRCPPDAHEVSTRCAGGVQVVSRRCAGVQASRCRGVQQESLCLTNRVSPHIQHSMSHAPSLLFPSHLSTSSLSTCTQSDPLSDHLPDLRCCPLHTEIYPSFGSMAETHSPSSYEPKDLTEVDSSKLVKPMFFHRPSMTSTYDSAS